MRLFIYECICAGALGAAAPASLRREGAAMLAAIVADFERVAGVEVVTLLADDALPTMTRNCRRISAGNEATAFRDIAVNSDAALVIAPEFDDLLSTRTIWAVDAGCRLLGSSPQSIRLAGDKLHLAQRLDEMQIPTPRTERINVEHMESPVLPCVCKPRHGAGSQATFLVRERDDCSKVLQQARTECPADDLLVQPFHPGTPVSVALFVGSRQIVATPGATQRLSDDGRFSYLGGIAPLPLPLRDRAAPLALRALAAVPGLQGYVGVDLILGDAADGSADVVVEINPRLTTSYIGLRQLTRTNLADVWLRLIAEDHIEPLTWLDATVEFTADGRTSLAVSRSQ